MVPKRGLVCSLIVRILISVAYCMPAAALVDLHTLPSPRDSQPLAARAVTEPPQTWVILAETTDARGRGALSRYQTLAQSVQRYYALNSYGQVELSIRFLHASGTEAAAGAQFPERQQLAGSPVGGDWFNVGNRMADYEGREAEFGRQALAQASRAADLREAVYLERAIVVCASPRGQSGRVLFPFTFSSPDGYLEIARATDEGALYVAHLIVLSEEDELGIWVHEIAHTLPCRGNAPDQRDTISDRYNDIHLGRQARRGQVGYWDLMGFGNLWGAPAGASPTHMSSYTKEAAGWLHYTSARWGADYTLTALEHQTLADAVLRLEDPLSDDPACYYIFEARDVDVAFGAPACGVVIYHVSSDPTTDLAVVDVMNAPHLHRENTEAARSSRHPTLHGVADPDGTPAYVGEKGGLVIRLLAETFAPYTATIRIERLG